MDLDAGVEHGVAVLLDQDGLLQLLEVEPGEGCCHGLVIHLLLLVVRARLLSALPADGVEQPLELVLSEVESGLHAGEDEVLLLDGAQVVGVEDLESLFDTEFLLL